MAAPQTPTIDDNAPVVSSDQEQEQHDREVFARLEAAALEDTGAIEPSVRTSEFADTPAPRPTPGNARGEPATPPAKPAKVTDADQREQVLIANAVLRRDGYDAEGIEVLRRSMPADKLAALVEKRRKVQGDQDRLGNELRAKGKPADPANPPANKPADQDGADPRLASLSAKQRAMHAKLVEEGDTDRAAEFLDAVAESNPGKGAGQNAGANQVADSEDPKIAEEVNLTRIVTKFQGPLDQLVAEYPELASGDARRELVKRADRLIAADAIDIDPKDQIGSVFRAAAAVMFGQRRRDPTAAQRDLIRQSNLERNGAPDATEARQHPTRAKTEDETDLEAYRLLAEGHKAEDVAGLLRQKRV